MIKQQFLAAAATLALVGTAVIALAGSADAIGPGTSGHLCASKGTALCVTHSGSDINTDADHSSWASQSVSMATDNVCGGTHIVDGGGTNCPFAAGSGLNTKYAGDTIVNLAIDNVAGCIGANAQNNVVFRSCPGQGGSTQGTEWVEDGQYALVNVYTSGVNGNGTGLYLTSTGNAGQNAVTVPWVANFSQWQFTN